MPNPTHEKKIMNLFIRKAAANIEISNKETWTLFIQDTNSQYIIIMELASTQ